MSFPRVSSLKTMEQFRERLAELGITLPLDEDLESGGEAPLARPISWPGGVIGNRFCILPMEGWDGETDGRASELTQRRWENFGRSGAKLIWGGEAVAVRHDGRANPNQLVINDKTLSSIEDLRERLERTHQKEFGSTSDLLVGLQLTHSGRFARPNQKSKPEPRIAYRHPLLDAKVGITSDEPILSDEELSKLIEDFIAASVLAQRLGFASWTSSIATAIWGMNCSPVLTGPASSAGAWKTALGFSGRSRRAFAPMRRDWKLACG